MPGLRAIAECATRREGAVRFGEWADLARHSARLSCKGGFSLLSPNLAQLYFFGKAIRFPEKREVRPCYQGLLFGIGFFFWVKSLGGKEVLEM